MLGERESTLLFARYVTRRARFDLSLAAPLIGCALAWATGSSR